MPKSSAAASALSALVAAGGGGWEVPGGFTEVEPRVFEDLAGKARTHNYQLSIYLTGEKQVGITCLCVGVQTARCRRHEGTVCFHSSVYRVLTQRAVC